MIESITTATGIKAVVDWFSDVTGIDCGCDKRHEKLNKKFSVSNTPKCLNLEQYETIKRIVDETERTHKISVLDQQAIFTIHKDIFRFSYSWPTSCSDCVRKVYNDVKAVYLTYEDTKPAPEQPNEAEILPSVAPESTNHIPTPSAQ